jgi:hypothetical protein
VMALRVAELELRETATRFRRIVVRDRRLEALAERRRLRELSAQPAEESNSVRARSRHWECILAARLSCVDPAPIV